VTKEYTINTNMEERGIEWKGVRATAWDQVTGMLFVHPLHLPV